jgi:D-alanyl-D-alanine dipeptidase
MGIGAARAGLELPYAGTVLRPFADVRYDAYSLDPGGAGADPASWVPDSSWVPEQPQLPTLTEPDALPPVERPAAGDDELLVPVEDRRIRVLAPYWHEGWESAVPGAWLRAEAARRLSVAADALPDGFGLAVFDAWRPLALQAELYDAVYADDRVPPGFVSEPEPDPRFPPPHLTGGTVDLTLTWRSVPLSLGTAFDDFTDDARTDRFEASPGPVRDLRRLLVHTMAGAGFVVLDLEWWHFEFGTPRWAALRGVEPRYGPAGLPTLLPAGP